MSQQADHIELLSSASSSLSRSLGRSVELSLDSLLWSPHFLARCNLVSESPDDPKTVIVKKITSTEFTADDSSVVSTRLLNEATALEFFDQHVTDGPWPRILSGNPREGLVVMEDLGASPPILHLLYGADRYSVARSIKSMGETLGQFHLAGLNRTQQFRDIQDRWGARSPRSDSTRRLSEIRDSVEASLSELRVDPAPRFWDEFAHVDQVISHQPAVKTVIHADAGPQNFIWDGRTAQILDFEFTVVAHPLLDVASARLGFPHCGQPGAVPSETVGSLENAYRRAVADGIDFAGDDSRWNTTLANACAHWAVGRWGRHWETMFGPGAPDEDQATPEMAGAILLYESFIETAAELGSCHALAETMERYVAALRNSWPQAVDLPVYPVFVD